MSTVAPPLFSQQPADAAVTPASGGCLLSRSGRLLRVDVEPACATALHTQHRGGSRTAGSPPPAAPCHPSDHTHELTPWARGLPDSHSDGGSGATASAFAAVLGSHASSPTSAPASGVLAASRYRLSRANTESLLDATERHTSFSPPASGSASPGGQLCGSAGLFGTASPLQSLPGSPTAMPHGRAGIVADIRRPKARSAAGGVARAYRSDMTHSADSKALVGDRSAVDVLARELHALSHGRAGGGRDAEPSPAHPPSPPSGGVSAGGARRWAGRHALLTNTSLDSRRLSAAAAAVVGGSPLRSPFGAGGSGGGAARADDADGSVSPPQGRVWARHGPSCMSPPRSGGGGATRVSPGGEHGVANGASALIRMSTRSLHATLGSSFRAHTLVHGGSPAEGGLQSQTHEALQQLLGQHHAPLARRVHGMRYSMPGMMPLDDESGAGCGAAAAGSSSAGGA
uniref:Uncharacterized protein n=1 Tax=Chlamydomonas euryale TaxID=1486919 RepID=A0A7R9V5A7_9CHLO|mmetsp:Transcript_17041/g.51100  ORF Transcript_17041/g.51100 Transcript_17041/m.51100 type:complete len:458 (+) Transcript_17041:465-1838(+)